MTEWNIVLVLASLLSFGVAVGAPLLKLNTTITKLIVVVDRLQKDLAEQTTRNSQSHQRIWDHNSEQDNRLDDHEHRIVQLEGK